MTPTVRTFRAPDPTSALAAVKAALGPEAVILATRTVDGGLFRRAEVEITAALEPAGAAPAARARRPAAAPPRPPPLPAAPAAPARPPDDPLQDELRRLRRSVEETRRALAAVTLEARAGRELQLPPAGADAYARLVGRGMEPALAEGLVRSALELGGADPGRAWRAVKDLLGERLVPCRAPWLHDGRRVIAAVGPTGVGKTTTLAKVAARALLETRKRVAFVTVDTYRLGGAEQLARYAGIMEVPVLVARDRGELGRALERLSDVDLVLLDTAGHASVEDVERQAALVRSVPRVQLHLTVSAAAGALELAAVADRYRALAPDRLVLTKLDEAAGPGSVLSAAVRVCRPIACVTNGQRVPEDVHALGGGELVDLVAGEDAP
ncbi:GTP-binding signal recognition particle SRP54 G- domain protein [Anaeromyxobacter dehalogenans 2CP-1]|uniref:Flagellar biosynthesis protein FlhF n=1 Tax=Anaeromyxobacter dehalogenans (strain ATCC BAA-258 / DSM 21875 / 2CP-1) TaxID=455488 RepID=B8JD84_ANAD2|nr:flagellar biosynthesis protein FlhF [Anaeromyxobacter dehalogenans]ACL65933.1 GTP-binding signal recognition particle SRP54 G- domain protein [Anaeromyxobacter dehalogenans 2CP-1]